MAQGSKKARIDDIIDRAGMAIRNGATFDAERIAHKAMMMAREAGDFERLAAACESIWTARSERVAMAKDAGVIAIIDEPITESTVVSPGCYLVEPPHVAADARRLRLTVLSRDVPVLVLCHEPMTQLKRWPIAAMTPGLTVRTHVAPPDDVAHPDFGWFFNAMDDLGDSALDSIDSAIDPLRRVDALLSRLDAVPDHEGVHRALIDACRLAEADCQDARLAASE